MVHKFCTQADKNAHLFLNSRKPELLLRDSKDGFSGLRIHDL